MRLEFRLLVKPIVVALSLALNSPALAVAISGAGSTFVQPIMDRWAQDYAKAGRDTVSYQSVGSGAGIQAIEAGSVDFGASDKPLSPHELQQFGLFQFPIVVGAIVPVVNLPGIVAGQLHFSGSVLARIYSGAIHRWDAPEIQDLNPRMKLPGIPIRVAHRSDGSGTTYNWTDFLARSDSQWRDTIGVGLSVKWPAGELAGNGNAGVVEAVKQTPGAIGYVEYAFAIKSGLAWGQVQNIYHITLPPTAETIQAAAATVDWKLYPDFSVLMTNAGGADAYPIAATTFILMPKKTRDMAKTKAVLAFFRWALENGDRQAEELHFVALPSNLIALIEAYWAKQTSAART